ncbi:spinster family MFS transporter [Parahaliea mediterranea]|uniref:MFS transporter n=1 Tax=Parahaliea mediterranea TaxID=651086 RepID=A0A939IMU2_9GAMM|nr:MFS transporter [Parahaliea mediterranea]MBN7797388.1 MFS transporter [Parahaliea mediterranea]
MKSTKHKTISISACVTLFALVMANISSLLDRSIMSLLVDPIKRDLEISDVQFGLLHGLAFALLYSVMGVPIGRLVDKYNRMRIIASGISVWSIMTALCGMASSYITLFLARVGVGVGEATLNPAAYSLLSDSFPRQYIARAIGVFMMATYVGVGLSYILAGALVNFFGGHDAVMIPVLGETSTWKIVFFIAAIPGFFIAAGMLCIKEPRRTGLRYNYESKESVSVSTLFDFLQKNKKSLITHLFGFIGGVAFANGLLLWSPTIIHNNHGVPIGEVGQEFGVLLIIVGGAGPFLGGWISDFMYSKNIASAPIKAAILLSTIALIPAVMFTWMQSIILTYILLSLVILILTAQLGLAITALQVITPNELRGQVSAIFLLVVNLVGVGFGPALIPFIAGFFSTSYGLNMAVSIVGCMAFLCSIVALAMGISAYDDSDQSMSLS